MKTAGTMFLSALLNGGQKAKHLAFGSLEHLFVDFEKGAYLWVKEHAKTYGDLPAPDTFEDFTKLDLPVAPEPVEFYLERLRDRYVHDSLVDGMNKAQSALASNHDTQAALKTVTEMVMQSIAEQHADLVIDFRQAFDIVMGAYYAKKSQTEEGVHLGWGSLDQSTGGLVQGDVVSIVGRPATGKSFMLCYNAHHTWAAQEKVPLLVSMEMNALVIAQREAAIATSMPFGKIKDGALPNFPGNIEKTFTDKLAMLKTANVPFWILDGNLSSSVEDIYAIARQLKPDCIYIDGAYLLTHPTEKNRYTRVAENTDLIKKELASLCPVVCSWQFSREATKKKKVEDVDLSDIGYTDAIGQISSIVLGLFQEDSIETANGRVIHILKGRNGEVGKFNTRWDFNRSDFSEVVETKLDEMQFS